MSVAFLKSLPYININLVVLLLLFIFQNTSLNVYILDKEDKGKEAPLYHTAQSVLFCIILCCVTSQNFCRQGFVLSKECGIF